MSSTEVEEIKSRLSIVDVASSYIKLEKAGQNFKARCPFHNEKSPSFTVSPTRDMYHCFGCDRGGDIISFVQEIEGVDFLGALKILADKAGVELSSHDKNTNSEKDKLYKVVEEATKFFENNLSKHKEALSYLEQRGLIDETIKSFRIGFVSDEWRSLYNFLKGKGVSDSLMDKAGLIILGQKGPYDRFRNRIMFPFFDPSGRPIAFSGRIFGKGDGDVHLAKYINSPAGVLYDKSKVLYGYDRAKMGMRKKDFCILVEGQFDLIMSHQAGFDNTVASSGTALTGNHLKNIQRMTNNLIVAFDSDEAGFSASGRGVDMALSLGMEVKAALLPQGLDPADLIKKNPSDWKEAIKNSKHIVDFYIDAFISKGLEERELGKKIKSEVLPYVGKIENKIDQAHFIGKIGRLLGVPEEAVRDEVRKVHLPAQATDKVDEAGPNREMIKNPLLRRNIIEHKILSIIFWQENEKEPLIDINKVIEEYGEIVGDGRLGQIRTVSDADKNKMILEAEEYYAEHEALEKDIAELLINLEKEMLSLRLEDAFIQLKKAEREKDQPRINDFLKKCHDLRMKIDQLSNSFN